MGNATYSIFEQILKEKGLKPADVSKATGIPQGSLSTWKKRQGGISQKNLSLIADYLGVSADRLCGIMPNGLAEDEKENEQIKEFLKNPILKELLFAGGKIAGKNPDFLLAMINAINAMED